jgi:hypothetical protein
MDTLNESVGARNPFPPAPRAERASVVARPERKAGAAWSHATESPKPCANPLDQLIFFVHQDSCFGRRHCVFIFAHLRKVR